MFVARNFLESVALVLDYALVIYMWLIIARAVLSWVSPDPRNPIVRFLYQVTEPLLSFLRRRLPLVVAGGLDLSPLVVLAAILFLRHFLVQTLIDLARTLG